MQQIITCTRRLTFEAGHRVMGHESKCANAHGHSYVAEIEATATLDDLGRVIDFSVLKAQIGGYIDLYLDHGFLVFVEDHEMIDALKRIPGQKIYYMPTNPTAENIAQHLLEVAPSLFAANSGVTITRVVIQETANCKAEARLG